MGTSFEELFQAVYSEEDTPDSLVLKLSARGMVDRHVSIMIDRKLNYTLHLFRKLNKGRRLSLATAYLRSKQANRTPPYCAYGRIFMDDHINPGSAIYDAKVATYVLYGDGWHTLSPLSRTVVMPFPLMNKDEIPDALLRLAIHLRCAFSIPDPAQGARRYGCVLVSRGETRFNALCKESASPIEVSGLEPGRAILFESDMPQDNGLLVWNDGNDGRRYGIAVCSAFYAVCLDQAGFQRDPVIGWA